MSLIAEFKRRNWFSSSRMRYAERAEHQDQDDDLRERKTTWRP
jgi:hypothetical protein